MKNFICPVALCLLSLVSLRGFSQCTPINCISQLPPYGGLCDSTIVNGRVNQYYHDSISFVVTNVCVDAGTLDPQYTGIGAKLLRLHTFSFSGLPAGITGFTSQTQYVAPANGCGSISGTPTEAGIFKATINIQADIRTWPFSTSCSGFITVDENNQAFNGSLSLVILPDPSFTGLNSTYCLYDPSVTLTPTGTTGGTFSGQGVNGNTFDPSQAGAGTFEIKYIVTAQQGAAVGPTTDSSAFTVTVTGLPAIVSQPDPVSVCEGDSAFFTCTGSGTGVTYQWQQKAPTDIVWSNAPGLSALTPTYQIFNVNAGMDGNKYRCVISDTCQAMSDSVVLSIHSIPGFNMDTTMLLSQSIILDAGAGFSNYEWSTGATTQTITIIGNVTGAGVHQYICTVTDTNGCKNSDSLTVTVIDDSGLGAYKDNTGMNVWPNPGKGMVNIDFRKNTSGIIRVEVNAPDGRLICNNEYTASPGNGKMVVDMSGQPAGLYFLKVSSDETIHYFKIIIQ